MGFDRLSHVVQWLMQYVNASWIQLLKAKKDGINSYRNVKGSKREQYLGRVSALARNPVKSVLSILLTSPLWNAEMFGLSLHSGLSVPVRSMQLLPYLM